MFVTALKEVDNVPKAGAGLKRSSAAEDWFSNKRRAMDIGDVRVTRKDGPNNQQGPSDDTDSVAKQLENMHTSDKQVPPGGNVSQ